MTGCLIMVEENRNIELHGNIIDSMQEVKEAKYVKPMLISFGDVRDITLGGSIPGGESLGNCIIGLEPGCNP